jgi:hypothetical protein
MTDEVKRALAVLDDLEGIGAAINTLIVAVQSADARCSTWERQWHQTNADLVKARAETEQLRPFGEAVAALDATRAALAVPAGDDIVAYASVLLAAKRLADAVNAFMAALEDLPLADLDAPGPPFRPISTAHAAYLAALAKESGGT